MMKKAHEKLAAALANARKIAADLRAKGAKVDRVIKDLDAAGDKVVARMKQYADEDAAAPTKPEGKI